MFGFGLLEVITIAMIVILLVPPKDLPVFLNKCGYWLGKFRSMSDELRRELNTVRSYADDIVNNPMDHPADAKVVKTDEDGKEDKKEQEEPGDTKDVDTVAAAEEAKEDQSADQKQQDECEKSIEVEKDK